MIETVEELHAYVNRYHVTARLDDMEGRLSIRGGVAVGISYKTERGSWLMMGVDYSDFDRLEISTADGWVSLENFDEKATAARIERFEALHNFETAARNYVRAVETLEGSHQAMVQEDRESLSLPHLAWFNPDNVVVRREALK